MIYFLGISAIDEPWNASLYITPDLCSVNDDGITDCFGHGNDITMLYPMANLYDCSIGMHLSTLEERTKQQLSPLVRTTNIS